MWEELERRGATIAVVPFSGRSGDGGTTGTISLSRPEGDEVIDIERWSGRNELGLALEGPVWDRYGQFAGHPRIRGAVTWTITDRCILITGQRGGAYFEETLT